VPMRRGHWTDRLPDIERDIAAMQKAIASAPDSTVPEAAKRALKIATSVQNRTALSCSHSAPASFSPGQPLSLTLAASIAGAHDQPATVRLNYRHVNQGERWRSDEMQWLGGAYRSTISGDYTSSPFPLQYYFELRHGKEEAWLYPGFNATFSNQPYYAVWKRDS